MHNAFLVTPFFLDRHSPELEALAQPGWALNRPELPAGTQLERTASYQEGIARFAAAALRRGERPVSIAGDCCAALGFTAGLQRAGLDPVLLWLDAHGDFNTWETTPSGFLGGMPLAMLAGRGEQALMRAAACRPLAESDLLLCDGRDLDPAEGRALAASGVVHLRSLQELLDYPLPPRPLYVHLDTDVINLLDAPAMSYPSPGGPSLAELQAAFRRLAARGNVAGVSVSTWNPTLDADGGTRRACMDALFALIQAQS